MARILALDYGTKRVGVAVTDPGQLIATGLTTVHAKDIFTFLEDYFKKETVECIVVGEPKRLNNEATQATALTEQFVKQLAKKFPGMKIDRMDERFTSKMAFQAMLDGGLKKKDRQNKETIDQVSATIILQSYMEAKKRG